MKIKEIDCEYYVFITPNKVTMTVRQYPYDGRFERSDTGFLGDKNVPLDIQKAILKFQKTNHIVGVNNMI
jgi:hypothetical protein